MYTITQSITTDLRPYNRQKSFYGKAKIEETSQRVFDNGYVVAIGLQSATLYSYNTKIATLYFCENGENYFYRFWGGYSATTMKHINSFLNKYGYYKYGGKTWWDKIPVEKRVKL